jgi:Cft2 family RNA processing exonuclease
MVVAVVNAGRPSHRKALSAHPAQAEIRSGFAWCGETFSVGAVAATSGSKNRFDLTGIRARSHAMSDEAALLRFVSGVGGKGPACFVIETGGRRLMLDLGEGPPPGFFPDIEKTGPLDALIFSHGHKDHVGGLSLLAKRGYPPVYATDIVAHGLPSGLPLRRLPVRGTSEVLGIEVETGRNGHAPGGVWLRFAIGEGVLYTGDFSTESILYAYDPPPAAATVLMDCSYGSYDKPIAECWNNLAPFVERGPLLLPVPANGRGPEMALELARRGFDEIYVDEAMHAALRLLCGSANISLRAGIGGEIGRLADAVKTPIGRARGVMLAASADGTSGATARLLADWDDAPEPAIVFTGYVPPATPAERLIKSGRGQFVRWNVHPRLSDTVALAHEVGAKTVIPAFCDRAQLAGLSAALAPARVTMDGPVGL